MSISLAKRYGIGCGDNSCVWGSPGDMGTNGGCRCLEWRNLAQEQTTQRLEAQAAIRMLRKLAVCADVAAALDQLVLAVRAKETKR